MPKNSSQNHSVKNPNNFSEQIGFRHTESVKTKLAELCRDENLRPGDLLRLIFNAGLKARYDIEIKGNQIVE